MGIGVTSGEVVVGNIGSERRTKYGVIGTPANLVARIEALSTGQQVLISSETLNRCNVDVDIVRAFEVSVKGVDHPLKICEVSAIHDGFDVRFTPQRLAMRKVHKSVRVEFAILDGKSVSDIVLSASLTASSRQQALLMECSDLKLRSDLRILALLVDGVRHPMEVYAKVTASDRNRVLLRFTSIFFKETDSFYEALLGLGEELELQ
jgi:hypothetical protein